MSLLKVVIRELKHARTSTMRPMLNWQRKANFPGEEARGIKMATFPLTQFGFLQNDQSVAQNAGAVRNYIDFNRSKGNYVQDSDGNTMLDLTGNAQLNPLGYNHELFRGAQGKDWDNALINGFGADLVSSHAFYELVESTFAGISPNGLTGVTLVNSRSAVADAVRSAMLERQQDGVGQNALYFSGSSHGSPLTLGGMICGWPTASYPRSASEEAEILEQVRSSVAEASTSAKHIAAVVIEPTQQGCGHRASDSFISSLSAICREFDSALIVDETNTGCYSSGNGTFWQYSGPADYVAFGGAAQATGYFSRQSGHSLAGNENDVRLLATILEGVEQDGLAKRSESASAQLTEALGHVVEKNASLSAARSSGTSAWVETASAEVATALNSHLRQEGVLARQVGSSIVARSTLLFGHKQVEELAGALLRFK